VHGEQTVLAVAVQFVCLYEPLGQFAHVWHTMFCVALHTLTRNCEAVQVPQLAHTVLVVEVHGVYANLPAAHTVQANLVWLTQ
jgi:hypothetical protein